MKIEENSIIDAYRNDTYCVTTFRRTPRISTYVLDRMDSTQLYLGAIKNFRQFQDVDERFHEISRIDVLESRPGSFLGIADMVIGEEPVRKGRSIRNTRFQF